MKLDISRVKKAHGPLLPANEPSSQQNTRRREQSSVLSAAYHKKVQEQSRFEHDLSAKTGRLEDLRKPRIIKPALPPHGMIAVTPERGYVLEQANMYVGESWPTSTPWGEALQSGMRIPVSDVDKYQYLFPHLGVLPETYSHIWGQTSIYENFILNNNKPPSKLFSGAQKKSEWQATVNMAVEESRTCYAYHVNKMNDDLGVYLHMDFVYRNNSTLAQDVKFTFPENEEQKAIWKNVFWGESLPQFPILPKELERIKTPSLISDHSSSNSSRGSNGSAYTSSQGTSADLLADDLGRLHMQPNSSIPSGSSKNLFFM